MKMNIQNFCLTYKNELAFQRSVAGRSLCHAEESPGSLQTGCWITSSGVGSQPILGKVPQKTYRQFKLQNLSW